MIKRWQETDVTSMLKCFRVVNLTGARQCGKTTLANMVSLPLARRFTLDDDETCKVAKSDPHGFVERSAGETVVIGEIQKAPELLNAIKMQVDKDASKGQYLLTGSANLHFVKAVTDSLAGRIGRVRLRTLSLGEMRGGSGSFLDMAFSRDFPRSFPLATKKEIIGLAARGGYPEAMDMDDRSRMKWFRAYLDNLLVKDMRDVSEIRKLDAMRSAAEWLLSYSSKLFEVSELATKAGVGKATIESYIATLKAMYLFDEIRPWTKSDYSKIGKRSKYFATDAGLVANILGWSEDSINLSDDRSGKIVENWVYQNLASLVDVNGDCEIMHYRDSNKREIDFIVERRDGAMLGIEVKAGSAFSASDFKHLKWFAANLSKGEFTGIVLYSGEHTLRLGEGFYAVPLAALGA